ncbi:MAG: 2-isopropylmalate synthase [gamma proteobacterium symbiont of Taylorina sp.]|nr:2-isopropylmalate synthase [gamma proteobacterium symbiont of Taylorina sp.]
MKDSSRHIQIMDTTLRDGEQTQGVSFSPDEKVQIVKALLEALQVDRIEVASARVSNREKEGLIKINQWAAENGYADRIEILGFVDHQLSVDWIIESGGRVLNLLTKGSAKHCQEQLGKTLIEHVNDIKQTLDYAFSHDLIVNVYLEDWSNGYADSRDYVFALMDELKGSGISHFMLPDTLGVMSPDEVYDSIKDMVRRYPQVQFDFHPHNDYGLAVANAMTAVKAGVSAIHCTINCLGERTGNASLAEVEVVLRDKMNVHTAIDETNIVQVSNMVENFSGKWVSANAPIVGADVFTQTAGIHADGDQKGGLYETRLSPERFSRKRSYALGKMSGKASLAKNLEELGLSLSKENQAKVLAKVKQLGDSKQRITLHDLPFIISDVMESHDYHHIKLLDCAINSSLKLDSTVSILVEIEGKTHRAAGSGNGGFDAFIDSISKIIRQYDFQLPSLTDFEVRIPKGGHTNALTECIITWDMGDKPIKTRGVNLNQVFAAISATIRMINILWHSRKINNSSQK